MTETKSWTKRPVDERKAIVGALYVPRDVTEEIREQIDTCREDARSLPEPTCVLVTGDSGTGKSSLLRSYLEAHPPRRVEGIMRRPVLMVELPVKATMLDAATAMLRAMEDPGAEKGTLDNRSHRVRTQLKLQGVEVVLIDEFQHIVEASGDRTLNKVGDWLKQQSKQTGIPFVLVGLSHSASVVDVNPQFGRICPYRFSLGPFRWDEQPNRVAFRRFLAELDSQLPFDELSRIADPDTARRLFLASDGSVSRLMLLIRKAAFYAIERDAPRIETVDLAAAYRRVIEPLSHLDHNPFEDDDEEAILEAVRAPQKRQKRAIVAR